MIVAHVKSTGAELTMEDKVVKIAGEPVTSEMIEEYDLLGVLEWVSPELRKWVLGEAGAVPSNQPETAPKGRTQENKSRKLIYGLVIVGGLLIIGLLVVFSVYPKSSSEQTAPGSSSAAEVTSEQTFKYDWDAILEDNAWGQMISEQNRLYYGGEVGQKKGQEMMDDFWAWAKARGYGTTIDEVENSLGINVVGFLGSAGSYGWSESY